MLSIHFFIDHHCRSRRNSQIWVNFLHRADRPAPPPLPPRPKTDFVVLVDILGHLWEILVYLGYLYLQLH